MSTLEVPAVDSLRPRHRPAPVPEGGYAVWAPRASSVSVEVDGIRHPMAAHPRGWWHAPVERRQGARYGFLLTTDDEASGDDAPSPHGPLPDPRSAALPDGVHGLSEVREIDPARWTDGAWTGRQLAGMVIYELHVGTFTPDGTLHSAIERLDALVALGITAVELMPLAAFDGPHGWGYDGVSWFAVHEAYGGPDALQDFVDAAHGRGLAVLLDVVYNHFGPSGNHAPEFGPYLAGHASIWGDSVNLDGRGADEVRAFIVDNALRWLDDFHIDGLRLDAVHALHDDSAIHVLEELSAAVDALSARLGRPLSLIAESDRNDPRTVAPRAAGGLGLAAQWCDDVHHAIHATVSGETQGYYADFAGLAALRKVLERAFFHDGTESTFRGRRHGRPVDRERTPGSAFVAYTCTHDQVGNRAAGDRPSAYLSPAQLVAKFALVATAPFTPMLFQGEEWGASTPFAFFASHTDPAVAEGTRSGRIAEFAAMGWDPAAIPDPLDPATFARSRLDWDERSSEPHAAVLAAYTSLLGVRRQTPDLAAPDMRSTEVVASDDGEAAHGWLCVRRGSTYVVVNCSDTPAEVPLPPEAGTRVLWSNDARLAGHGGAVSCEPWGVAIVAG